jgi:energy-converting hydrogenase Eha subunit B
VVTALLVNCHSRISPDGGDAGLLSTQATSAVVKTALVPGLIVTFCVAPVVTSAARPAADLDRQCHGELSPR